MSARSFNTITLHKANGAARLTLNRPERLNSFTVEMHKEVAAALSDIEADKELRVLVITGAGRGFCAGQDLNDRAVSPGSTRPDLGASLEDYYNPFIRRLINLPMPVIAAVNGVAAGAGANIALACDIVIARNSAKFIQSFSNIGLSPDSGGTWSLPRLVGQARAMGLALTGAPVTGEQAAEWGMIWQSVDDEKFEESVEALAQKFAAAPTRGMAGIKKAIRASHVNTLAEHLNLERDLQRDLGQTDDYAEGVAAFMEKRKPVFNGQ